MIRKYTNINTAEEITDPQADDFVDKKTIDDFMNESDDSVNVR